MMFQILRTARNNQTYNCPHTRKHKMKRKRKWKKIVTVFKFNLILMELLKSN